MRTVRFIKKYIQASVTSCPRAMFFAPTPSSLSFLFHVGLQSPHSVFLSFYCVVLWVFQERTSISLSLPPSLSTYICSTKFSANFLIWHTTRTSCQPPFPLIFSQPCLYLNPETCNTYFPFFNSLVSQRLQIHINFP